MFRLIIAVLSLASVQAYADETVRVTGRGTTFYQARYDGYLQAVEKASGSALLSQKSYRDRKTVENKLSVYSAGYQKQVKIISTDIIHGEYHVVMDVTISSSHLQRGLLGQSESTQFIDSDIHQDQINTYLETRKEGDDILISVLRDFPQNAFVIVQGNAEISVVNGNTVQLIIPYSMIWNAEWLGSFEEAVSLLSDKNVEYQYAHNGFRKLAGEVCIERSYNGRSSCQKRYTFNDSQRINIMKKMLGQQNQPAVRVVLSDDHGNILDDRCHIAPLQSRRPNFYGYGINPSIRFFYSDLINSAVGLHLQSVKDIKRVDMYPVAKGTCKNWYTS